MSKVIYVEDNPDSVALMRLILESDGETEMLSAPDGLAGLELVRDQLPDLVLVDLDLPRLDGIELARRLRADSTTADTPIIAVSAHVMRDESRRCIDAGCVAFIAKPFDIEHLKQTVRRFLDAT